MFDFDINFISFINDLRLYHLILWMFWLNQLGGTWPLFRKIRAFAIVPRAPRASDLGLGNVKRSPLTLTLTQPTEAPQGAPRHTLFSMQDHVGINDNFTNIFDISWIYTSLEVLYEQAIISIMHKSRSYIRGITVTTN